MEVFKLGNNMVNFAFVEHCVKNDLVEGAGRWWWLGGEIDGGVFFRGLLVH